MARLADLSKLKEINVSLFRPLNTTLFNSLFSPLIELPLEGEAATATPLSAALWVDGQLWTDEEIWLG